MILDGTLIAPGALVRRRSSGGWPDAIPIVTR